MLYYITILIIFVLLVCAGFDLLKNFRHFQKRKEKLMMKESEFIDKLLSKGEQQTDQSFQKGAVIEDHATDKDVKKENELGINEVRAFIYEIINKMSEKEIRRLLKDLEESPKIERRKCGRKDFLRIIDYTVSDHYYRDFIQDISETGLFIKPSQTFSVGQTVSMTFMSPDNQKPFKINGEIVRVHTDGIGVRFKIESQVQKSVLKSYVDMIQS